jgi:hypothetical protein
MLTIAFISLSVTALLIVLFLALSSIRKGLDAKNNRSSRSRTQPKEIKNNKRISNEIKKLDKLRKSGVLTKQEFNKAKARLFN